MLFLLTELKPIINASITESGAILLGEFFEIDSYAGRPVRVVTHMHSDHTLYLSKSKRHSTYILATQPTLDSLTVLGEKLPENKTIPLGYNKPLRIVDETITFVKSTHVIGSAQVVVETKEGFRLGYTSDFKFPGTKIMSDLDVLVIDATYGQEHMIRPFKQEIETLLADLVNEILSKNKPVRILGYYGKLQEVMEILRKNNVSAPFVMPKKVYELTNVACKHGMKINDFFEEDSKEGSEVKKDNWYVYFQHMNSKKGTLSQTADLILSGWFFESPIKKIIEKNKYEKWLVAFSDHGDFQDVFAYVSESKPKMLIVDGSRTDRVTADFFSNFVKKKLNLKSSVLPSQKIQLKEED
ncbi:exonuclease of the beta-lactamase fold involved in RNA processing-like protein [Fervidicoccus fontis Kam940]|uniref:Exonuclease of the beta-lactamase fold involved in RNA processing-like protein n=1 Tax=Fervidicoccus fontis (strain DSM 19380 / JCM 18336 / VKM B-2539 / Kam940) TaxID=1163730 RepID=I0A238_FERFK|nr:exonuclease of the beta-lactamase fold involved in RNA processing-like protein [Fervidicoccus fontis Kam940]